MSTHFLERFINADTVFDLRHAYFDAMRHFGFAQVLYAARFMASIPPEISPSPVELHSNFPPTLAEALAEQDLIAASVWSDWARQGPGSIATRSLYETAAARLDQDAALQLASAHGLAAGQVVSLRDRVLRGQGTILLVPFAGASHAEADRIWERSHREVMIHSWVLHMRMATLRHDTARVRLTTRQREVLEWKAAGKTVADIATILAVTPATVEKHLRLARDALAAGNTAQAILKAHLTHQLFVQEHAGQAGR
ncbi:helix-turn-helix transcriptional regulator [Paracoccus spongiarum]|uniref:Autoinducer binding domain-containing protein n=1 Tax=Paracoccus spongiarum TaxID=3064387 RepID=A0ABT9J9H3_9RHOB|nr:LuxR family transcriptional regulator [Paracoccus sp. 2205BS29-5]MDP5306461.1 autoinducer binding domain-containing protein [Paracoccus sp. 2205BS29-5]